MTNQSSKTQSSPQAEGIFDNYETVTDVHAALRASGIPAENISIETYPLNPTPRPSLNRAREGVRGGAIAGAIFGLVAALLLQAGAISLHLSKIAFGNFSPIVSSIGIALLGALFGTLVGTAIGGISGANTPSEESIEAGTLEGDDIAQAMPSETFHIHVRGEAEDISKANTIFRERTKTA